MRRTNRAVHLLGALVIGGAQRILKDLLPALQDEGIEVELLVLTPRLDGFGQSILDTFRQRGIPIRIGPTRSFRPQTVAWLRRRLRGRGAGEVVNLHLHYTERAYYFSRWFHQRRYRVLRTLHSTALPNPGLERRAFDRSDVRCTVACGDAIADAYREIVCGEMKTVVSGVRFDWPRHDPQKRDERLAGLGLGREWTHFVTVGRMAAGEHLTERSQKGYDDLLAAWRSGGLGERGGRLHLLGDGPARPLLEAMGEGDPSIRFHGTVSNVHEWLGAVDTYVMPSRTEGLPIAGMEAAGTGIRCVFSDIAPLRELRYGAATYFPVRDTDALADCLVERLGRFDTASAAETDGARERFGIGRMAREYLGIYERL